MATAKQTVRRAAPARSRRPAQNLPMSALEASPVCALLADASEKVTFINARAREVMRSLDLPIPEHISDLDLAFTGGRAAGRLADSLGSDNSRHDEISIGGRQFSQEVRVLGDAASPDGYAIYWEEISDLARFRRDARDYRTILENSTAAVMMVDSDFTISYVNAATESLMTRHENTMRDRFTGFQASKLVGTSIDVFHKDPRHQRAMLVDPARMPHETDIHVGDLTFNLYVTGRFDEDGQHLGNVLQWRDVTEERANEEEVSRLTRAVRSANTPLMLTDDALTVDFVNPALTRMMQEREDEFRKEVSGFKPKEIRRRPLADLLRDPDSGRALISGEDSLPVKTELKIGELTFRVEAAAARDDDGNFLGAVVEWRDLTDQKNAEGQVRTLIEAAANGEFSERIDPEQFDGFLKQLAELLNRLMQATESGIGDVVRVVRALADGTLTETITEDYDGLLGRLKDDVNATVENLRGTVSEIRGSAETISTSASEIAQGNTDLSQRTEEQASSLEETASSMEEMTSTVKSNADNARQANQLATGARGQAEQGGQVVTQAISAMGEINSASKKIANIIGVIDEIAFQTNLLALNAAVEAARAGDQGRGFAVVAAEVRNLAQRSATAAKEIKELIEDSVEKVSEGSRLVDESGKTLQEIVDSVKKVSDIVGEIAAANEEQSAGIEQVNKAVMQLDEVTQQNAALVEEAAASSESLDDNARQLIEMMGHFKLGDHAAPAAAPERRAPDARAPAARPGQSQASRPAPTGRKAPAKTTATADSADEEWEEF